MGDEGRESDGVKFGVMRGNEGQRSEESDRK